MARYRLGSICQIISGSTPKTGVQEYWNGDKKWITPAELSESDYIIYDTERKLTEAGVRSAGLTPLPKGTVILSSRAPIGKVAIAGCEMYCNQGFKNFVCSNIINNKYLYWYLRSKTDFLNSLGRGATFKEISKSTVADIELDIPELSEQSKRVAHLEKLQSIIASRRIQLAKLDELVKCRFVELFGDVIHNDKKWAICNLGDITSSRLGKMLDAKLKTGRNNYPYLANFNVQWFHFELNQLNEMDFDDNERIEFQLKEGDLLVCEGGEIGRCAVWHNELEQCFFQKALHRVRCDVKKVLPDYVAWWFKYNCDNKGFDGIAGAKATIAHLPGVKLKKLRIAVPDIQLQEDFTIFLSRIDKLRFVIRQSLDETQKLFDSLMQEYFE